MLSCSEDLLLQHKLNFISILDRVRSAHHLQFYVEGHFIIINQKEVRKGKLGKQDAIGVGFMEV